MSLEVPKILTLKQTPLMLQVVQKGNLRFLSVILKLKNTSYFNNDKLETEDSLRCLWIYGKNVHIA